MERKGISMLPRKVHITEVGPRDGLQMEKKIVPTDMKAALIQGLVAAGVRSLQVAAFVHPQKVPQMADAEGLIARLPMAEGVQFSALALNRRGVERACATAIPWIEVSLSVSERQSRDNSGMTVEQGRKEAAAMIELAHAERRKVRGSIQCSFGCLDECEISSDTVPQAAALLLDSGVDQLVLADTTGMATPVTVRRMLSRVMPLTGKVPLVLHLHDTRGLGLVNLMAGLEMGIAHFDTSLGGLGGCPFVKGAAGNIATEDTLHLLRSLSIETGVDLSQVAHWARKLSAFFGRELTGKMHRLTETGYCTLNGENEI
jgi:hydroxymethylglutaryl-CoA lyase